MATTTGKRSLPVLVYDGDCGFCTTSARVARRISGPTTNIAAWQHLTVPSVHSGSGSGHPGRDPAEPGPPEPGLGEPGLGEPGLGQPGLDELGLTEAEAAEAAWWIDADGTRWQGADAVARFLQEAGRGWAVIGSFLRLPLVRTVARVAYRLIARYRYRLPGGTPACRVPRDGRPSVS